MSYRQAPYRTSSRRAMNTNDSPGRPSAESPWDRQKRKEIERNMGMDGYMAGFPSPESPQEIKEKADEMLKNLGARVMEVLQGGGRQLDKFDRAYAQRSADLIGDINAGPMSAARHLTSAVPLGDVINNGIARTGDWRADAALNGMNMGAGVANVASRYALPAGGLTLAGMALEDLTSGLYEAAEQVPLVP